MQDRLSKIFRSEHTGARIFDVSSHNSRALNIDGAGIGIIVPLADIYDCPEWNECLHQEILREFPHVNVYMTSSNASLSGFVIHISTVRHEYSTLWYAMAVIFFAAVFHSFRDAIILLCSNTPLYLNQ